ncbi:hypothetical protein Dsin_008619 [Dipteronia sinensis]|uniref:BED-type domain-containing protein n=1 Tax=Dipteronia sinensis TaxID=43782 RepID=A0AAE0AQ60_9ROSI|nr:hypothetical protein Dsin_008619 [Dipteronia sinensis]
MIVLRPVIQSAHDPASAAYFGFRRESIDHRLLFFIYSSSTSVHHNFFICSMTTFYRQKSVTPSNTSEPPIIEGTSTLDSIPPNVDMLDNEPEALDNGANNSSWAWDHFIQLSSDPKSPKSKCWHCGKVYARGKEKTGTSNLLAHLKFRCRKFVFKRDSKQKQLFMQKKIKRMANSLLLVIMKRNVGKHLLGLLCLMRHRLKLLRGRDLSTCLVFLNLDFMFHVEQLLRVMFCKFMCMKNKLKDFFVRNQQRVCLITDTWTSIQNINYMYLTAHFVYNNWKLKKKILIFCPISNHKGDTIGKALETCLKSWGI